MNDYQKAIMRGIETGLDNHFSKEESKKVCLTVEEAKDIATLCGEAEFYAMQGENIKAKRLVGKARDLLVERIEQAEGK